MYNVNVIYLYVVNTTSYLSFILEMKFRILKGD